MIRRQIPRLMLVMLLALVLTGAVSAFAAANTVPATRLGQQVDPVNANALKPPQCAAANLTRVVVCLGGNCDGTAANELLLGTENGERIRGRGGRDCIVGGGGDDILVGNGSQDVCIGGPGNDTFLTCETRIQ
jgi:Ca2+-binding RTX toxin-like protein